MELDFCGRISGPADASGPLFPQALRSQGVNRIDDLSLIIHGAFTSKLRQQSYPQPHALAGLLQSVRCNATVAVDEDLT